MTKEKDWEPKIVAFLCNWCSYAGADLAGTSRIEYPPNVRIIRVPCSGRMNPLFVIRCLMKDVDGVLISGCHIGDCHYSEGNFYARRRFAVFKKLLEYMGIDPRRFQMSWVSASEGDKWAKVVRELVDEIKSAGPNSFADRLENNGLSSDRPQGNGLASNGQSHRQTHRDEVEVT